jgi:hypothetical protein
MVTNVLRLSKELAAAQQQVAETNEAINILKLPHPPLDADTKKKA